MVREIPWYAPDVVILCGGKGTRLGDLTRNIPKPMITIAGKPVVHHIIDSITGIPGIKANVILAAGHHGQQIAEYFRDYDSVHVCVEESPRGTGGALRAVEEHIFSDTVLVMNGDTFSVYSAASLLWAHHRNREYHPITVLGCSRRTKAPGSVRFNVTSGGNPTLRRGRHMVHSWGSGEIEFTGICVINRSVINIIPRNREVSLEHAVIPFYSLLGLVAADNRAEAIVDVGTPECLEVARKWAGSTHDHGEWVRETERTIATLRNREQKKGA